MNILVTDLDNTLYDFISFFGPSFRGMVHALSRRLGVQEELLFDQYRDVYSRFGTVEYRESTQNLTVLQALPEAEQSEVVRLAYTVFGQTRKRNLALYPGVKETLTDLKNSSYKVVACTNAPIYHALRRIEQLGLSSHFDAVIGWNRPMQESPAEVQREMKLRSRYATRTTTIVDVAEAELKPSKAMFKYVVDMYPNADRYFAVGDSISKDLLPASELGFQTVWAEYGTHLNAKDLETVNSVVPWSDKQLSVHYQKADGFKPTCTVQSFSELTDVANIPKQIQMNLGFQ